MGAPKIQNQTPFQFAAIFAADIDGQPLFTPLLKASFAVELNGRLAPVKRQPPILPGGEWWGAPDSSSLKFEAEATLVKPASDVVLLGHVFPSHAGAVETKVGIKVGPVRKVVHVTGDRWWIKRRGMMTMTAPRSIDRIPLRWERAFGGWDRTASDPQEHRCEARNPVGTGFRVGSRKEELEVALPNLEDPQNMIRSFDDRPPPAGFGFISHHWHPRAGYAGTYDLAWNKSRRPLLPLDFDRRFLNAAPADQIVTGYLRGNERVEISNASERGRLQFALPGNGAAPVLDVVLQDGTSQTLMPVLDTLIIDTDNHVVSMLWRASLRVTEIPSGVRSVFVQWEGDWVAPDYRRFGIPS